MRIKWFCSVYETAHSRSVVFTLPRSLRITTIILGALKDQSAVRFSSARCVDEAQLCSKLNICQI